uniref:Uncharacterized protein n=1 Tax=Anguilla anguilla TaxID=7936 RepID=A0A0E9UFP4_ANGAN
MERCSFPFFMFDNAAVPLRCEIVISCFLSLLLHC